MVGTGPAFPRTFGRASALGAAFARRERDVARREDAASRGVVADAGLICVSGRMAEFHGVGPAGAVMPVAMVAAAVAA